VNYVAGGLTLSAAAAYTNARIDGNVCDVASDTTPNCDMILVADDPTTPDVNEEERDIVTAPDGRRLPVTPKFKITGTARYSWNVGPGKAHTQLAIVHQGSAPSYLKTEDAVLGKIPASTIVDAFAGYDWRNMSFEVFGTNIFDKRNQLSRFIICGSFCASNDYLHIVPGRPRTIGIRAGMKF
jgi:iron complex outermembrane recepter protein